MPPIFLDILVLLALIAAGAALLFALRRERPRADEQDQRVAERIAALERDLAHERDRTNLAERALAEKTGILDERNRSFAALEDERLRTQDAFAKARDENVALLSRIATLETEARGTREALTAQFKELSDAVLERQGTVFAAQNRSQIDAILQPLREQVTDFRTRLENAHTETAKERAVLADQIKRLSEDSARMTAETTSLTQALRGNSQTQGAWGEMVLETILERSGLRKGEEYILQEFHTTEDGNRLRPDVTVFLPGGERIIIDSKVSLTAFDACVGAANDDERQLHLKRHVQSMQTHIKTLADKDYAGATGSRLDYVLMFVPIEGALAAALEHDPALTSFAVKNKVAITTPTTLMVALRTVGSLWKIEYRNRYADEIADRAGKMYDKFVNFIEDLTELGRRLDQAQSAYGDAFGKLKNGPGSLVGQFQKMKDLGAHTKKAIPPALLESS